MDEGSAAILIMFIVGLLAVGLWFRDWRNTRKGLPKMYCLTCGEAAVPEQALRGNFFITFLLIWLMIIPALVYSIWRRTGPYDRCAVCGKATVIPLSSPMAQKAMKAELGQ